MKLQPENLRLYAVTDRTWLCGEALEGAVERALSGGATCVQLREKNLPREEIFIEALRLKPICKKFGVPLIINDDVTLALEAGADGVHVGQHDTAAEAARAVLGAGKIVGVSARTVEQARSAVRAGADYLGVGAVFGTSTKADARPIARETLTEICRAVRIPVVAIGGVSLENLPSLAGTGVAGAAVVSAIFAADDIEAACRALKMAAEEAAR